MDEPGCTARAWCHCFHPPLPIALCAESAFAHVRPERAPQHQALRPPIRAGALGGARLVQHGSRGAEVLFGGTLASLSLLSTRLEPMEMISKTYISLLSSCLFPSLLLSASRVFLPRMLEVVASYSMGPEELRAFLEIHIFFGWNLLLFLSSC